MKTVQIKHQFTGAVLFSTEVEDDDPYPIRTAIAHANLTRAYLTRANLAGANLAGARDDFRSVLDTSPDEVATLLVKLRAGEIDGSQYQGECACLVGTIAIARNERYDGMPQLQPDSSRPSERWFLGIRVGDTPSTNQIAAITDDWICEWQAERGQGDWHTEAV